MKQIIVFVMAAFVFFASCSRDKHPSTPGATATETSVNTATPNATATALAGFIDNFEPFDMMIMFPGANMWAINTDMALYGGTSGPPVSGGSLSPGSNCLAVTTTVTAKFGPGPDYFALLRIGAPLPGSYDMSAFSSLSLDWASSFSAPAGYFSVVFRIVGTLPGYAMKYDASLPGLPWVVNYSMPFSSWTPEGLTPCAETLKNVGEVQVNIYYYSSTLNDTGAVSVFIDNVRFKN